MKRIARTTVVMTVADSGHRRWIASAHNSGQSQVQGVHLKGVKEVPVVSTTGTGTFKAPDQQGRGDRIHVDLQESRRRRALRRTFTSASGQNTGPIVLWLCQTAQARSRPRRRTKLRRCFHARSGDPPRFSDIGMNGVVTGTLTPKLTSFRCCGNGSPTWDEVVSLIRDGRTIRQRPHCDYSGRRDPQPDRQPRRSQRPGGRH